MFLRKKLVENINDSDSSQIHISWTIFNPLPDDKILNWSKLKKIADNIAISPLLTMFSTAIDL